MSTELISLALPARASLRQRMLALRAQALFEGLDDEGLLLLAEHVTARDHRDGEVVCAEGQASHVIVLVTQGELVVSRHGREVAVRSAGEAFGALALIARETTSRAVARGLTRTLEVPGLAFEAALTESQALMRKTLTVVGERVLAMRHNLPASSEPSRVIDEGRSYERRRSLVELLIQLRDSPFGHINLDALVDMARHMKEVRYPAGERLWSIGDPSSHALHVDAGRVRCTAPDGRSVDVGVGFTIGALDVWGDHVRAYDAETVTPVIGFRIDFEDFLSMLETHPEVGLELLRGFARGVVRAGDGS